MSKFGNQHSKVALTQEITEALPARCFWVEGRGDKNRKEMWYIPKCMGGAASGPEGCTCFHPLSEKETEWKKKYRALLKRYQWIENYADWAKAELKRNSIFPYPVTRKVTSLAQRKRNKT